MKLTSLAGDDKKWAKKYRSQILSNFQAFKFNGYPYPMNIPRFEDAATFVDKVGDITKVADDNTRYASDKMSSEDKDDIVSSMRASICKVSGSFDDKEYKDELHKMLYGESKEDIDITSNFITTALNNIENVSIIESLPDDLKNADGDINTQRLVSIVSAQAKEYMKRVICYR